MIARKIIHFKGVWFQMLLADCALVEDNIFLTVVVADVNWCSSNQA